MRYFSYILLLITIVFIQVSQATPISDEKSCIDCHKSMIEKKLVHPVAADDCENCHMSNGKKHPNGSEKGFELADKVPSLCFMCHEEFSKKNIHMPAAEGECMSCHSPHASNNPSLLLEAPTSKLCFECHDSEIINNKNIHVPVAEGDCQNCHDPHQSDNSYFLKQTKPALCAECHDNIAEELKMENIHPPFDDDCANCHSPHSSNQAGLLLDKQQDLCFMCHDDIQSLIQESKTVHQVINSEKQCTNCHSPHASNNDFFLKKNQNEMCLSCHNKTIKSGDHLIENIANKLKDGNVVHQAIEGGGCNLCHNPHASNNQKLLTAAFPETQYTEGISENFELCFICHDPELIEQETSTTITKFRDGNKNLHYVHVNGKKGRNCIVCHDVHGSKSKNLIKPSVKFGEWNMPIRYKETANGGSCNTGCHVEKFYKR